MHNIEYYTYRRDVDKQKVQKTLDNYVAHEDWQEGCTGLYRDIRWVSDKVYLSREEAENAISRLDHGNYDQVAVLFEDSHLPGDKKEKDLRTKMADQYKEYMHRERLLYADTVTAMFIGCKKCGSKLSRVHIKANSCPVCHEELRPDHMLKSVDVAKKRWQKTQAELNNHIKMKGKKEVKWLVKIEYHT